MEVYDILFELLRAGLFGGAVSEETREHITKEEIQKKLYISAKKHDIVHLLAYSVEKCGLLVKGSEFEKRCVSEQMKAVYRYENINHELGKICKTLENAEIPCILLKGSVIRQYYPEPWMRTSCDIDILVKADMIDRAAEVIVEKLNYDLRNKTHHDYQLFSPGNVYFELHYSLLGDDSVNETADGILENVWENVIPVDGYKYCFKMTDDMFYYYHILHMAKHIKFGGCGIRPFLDLYILENSVKYGGSKKELLEKGGLIKTESAVRRLAKVYFEGMEHDRITKTLSEYILFGGVYGNVENIVAMSRATEKGKFNYALSRVFAPYDVLKYRYPELEEKKWLFVPYQFRRWFDILFKGKAKASFDELNINRNIAEEKIENAARLWQDLGL